jgi:hypothetical protein
VRVWWERLHHNEGAPLRVVLKGGSRSFFQVTRIGFVDRKCAVGISNACLTAGVWRFSVLFRVVVLLEGVRVLVKLAPKRQDEDERNHA